MIPHSSGALVRCHLPKDKCGHPCKLGLQAIILADIGANGPSGRLYGTTVGCLGAGHRRHALTHFARFDRGETSYYDISKVAMDGIRGVKPEIWVRQRAFPAKEWNVSICVYKRLHAQPSPSEGTCCP